MCLTLDILQFLSVVISLFHTSPPPLQCDWPRFICGYFGWILIKSNFLFVLNLHFITRYILQKCYVHFTLKIFFSIVWHKINKACGVLLFCERNQVSVLKVYWFLILNFGSEIMHSVFISILVDCLTNNIWLSGCHWKKICLSRHIWLCVAEATELWVSFVIWTAIRPWLYTTRRGQSPSSS